MSKLFVNISKVINIKEYDGYFTALFEEFMGFAMIFKFGINTGLRISDIIPLKVNDIFNEKWQFGEHLTLNEASPILPSDMNLLSIMLLPLSKKI
jgi:integrase